MPAWGVYREVVEPERLVFEEPAEDAWHEGAVSIVSLTDLGDGRTELVLTPRSQTTDEMRAAAEAGLRSSIDRLAQHLRGVRMTTSTRLVTGVDFVSVPTRDLDAAREFYEKVLGLEASSVWQRPGQEALGAEFETGTVTIALIDVSRWDRVLAEQGPDRLPGRRRGGRARRARITGHHVRGRDHRQRRLPPGVLPGSGRERADLHHRYAPR